MHVPRLILETGISTRGICCCHTYMRIYSIRDEIGVDIYDTVLYCTNTRSQVGKSEKDSRTKTHFFRKPSVFRLVF